MMENIITLEEELNRMFIELLNMDAGDINSFKEKTLQCDNERIKTLLLICVSQMEKFKEESLVS